jgi:hypothetical protein
MKFHLEETALKEHHAKTDEEKKKLEPPITRFHKSPMKKWCFVRERSVGSGNI